MNIVQVEENLKKISNKFSKESFIFDLMTAYDFPKSTISKLKIKNKDHDDIVVPSKLHFVCVSKKELDSKFNELVKYYSTVKKAPRFIIVTDYQNLKAYDNKVAEKLDTEIKNLSKHPDFFLPWAGIEKKVFQGENPADVKAAEKLAKFFDLILKDNIKLVEKNRHSLNVFLTRILFCFFAEDTDIYKKGLFTESLASHTNSDGSDLDNYLQRLFEVLNKKSRTGLPDFLKEFPYVNGGLFAEDFPIPKFSKKSRESLIDLGSDLNWAEINPDIFGSMIQAVVHPDKRSGLGMHYTSVTNILKVIEPLFLTELKEEFTDAKGNKSKLNKLLYRIGNMKIFDPACGSGNFLIIAYKELRLLEMDILRSLGGIPMSGITLSNFYGIEIDDFAHEVAKLSLWLAEHQMDVLFNREFGEVKASLPLKDSGHIICGNATELDWKKICPLVSGAECFIAGNPPYLGYKGWNQEHKEDMDRVFLNMGNVLRLDYIACWFKKASDFIVDKKAKFAFVTTNSITQGEQVNLLWPYIFDNDQEIYFGHNSFKWTNNARSKASVSVVIIGIRNKSKEKKILISNEQSREVKNISPYLTSANNIHVEQKTDTLSDLPEMALGSSGIDGGHLILSEIERDQFISEDKNAAVFIRKFIGGRDFLQSVKRFCLWIDDDKIDSALSIKNIKNRIEACRKYRLSAGRDAKKAAAVPHRFFYRKYKDGVPVVVPLTSSENREYLTVGFEKPGTIVSNGLLVIYDCDSYVFTILSSKLHWLWTKAVSGKLKTDIRYSVNLVYNNFPVPKLTESQKSQLRECAFQIISARAKYSNKTLADLYSLGKMPQELKDAHLTADSILEKCYRKEEFKSDDERMEFLFELYVKMNKVEK